MEKLIADMMQWANVTEAELRSKGVIHTAFGEHWFHTEEQMRFLDDWIRSCEGENLCSHLERGRMETERLILDSIRESDKEDYFINISHDKKVLETFICWEILDCEGTAAKASRQRERCHNLAG